MQRRREIASETCVTKANSSYCYNFVQRRREIYPNACVNI